MWKLFLTTLIGLPLRSAQVRGKCDPEWTASNKPKCSVIYDTLERFLRFYKTKLFSQSLFYVCLIFFDQLLALLAVLCSDSRVCIPHCPKAHTVGQWHSIHPPLDWCEEGDKLGSCVNVAISFKSADPRNQHWLLYGIWPSIVSVTKYENLDFTLESVWSHWTAPFFWGAQLKQRRTIVASWPLHPFSGPTEFENRSIYWSTNDLHVLFISFYLFIHLDPWIFAFESTQHASVLETAVQSRQSLEDDWLLDGKHATKAEIFGLLEGRSLLQPLERGDPVHQQVKYLVIVGKMNQRLLLIFEVVNPGFCCLDHCSRPVN